MLLNKKLETEVKEKIKKFWESNKSHIPESKIYGT